MQSEFDPWRYLLHHRKGEIRASAPVSERPRRGPPSSSLQGRDRNVVTWDILLERADDARRREGEGVLRGIDRMDLRLDADAGRRHLLDRKNGRQARLRHFF